MSQGNLCVFQLLSLLTQKGKECFLLFLNFEQKGQKYNNRTEREKNDKRVCALNVQHSHALELMLLIITWTLVGLLCFSKYNCVYVSFVYEYMNVCLSV